MLRLLLLEYLSREDVNVITVDWTALSSGLNYPVIALNNVPAAGDYVGAFIDYLIEEGTPVSSFHLIGGLESWCSCCWQRWRSCYSWITSENYR